MPDIQETISWQTDIGRADVGEMRHSLRGGRGAYRYSFMRSGDYLAAEGLYRSAPLDDWLVPAWADAVKAGAVADTDLSVTANTSSEWGDKALIFGCSDDFVVADVASVGVGEITLSAAVGKAYDNPSVMPLHLAYISDVVNVRAITTRHVGIEMTFVRRDEMAEATPSYQQFGGLYFLPCASRPMQNLAGGIGWPVEVIDNEMGPVVLEQIRAQLEAYYSASMSFGSSADVKAFRAFLSAIRGRDGAFWVGSYGGALSFVVAPSAGATTLRIAPLLRTAADYVGRSVRVGNEFRTITAASEFSATEHRLTVAALSATATTGRLLRKVRLESDAVELRHRRGLGARCTFTLAEVTE
ncbi:hypothetical protein OE699_02015 [Sedimentimonas flavescens]|uniref:Uncharacterized protein n=1 Tax=Sedimentimonas flavescens TaxID=2851012 RepID=A0ABT2ZV44_9RHOB|nr:hypothetical protein [Sedimentimonas flavescens]MCV2877615.1 hypothetical protein [Sedimentimonas flavescens]